ncbi:A-kinase anchor protein 9-like [Lingula anatina]|uniref:A-kinase anchor protein 9-like n=1 Tax=Lingula anatina TaxID=7574 RepID=A0A2R2MQE4_LINAN|nr:A-kinase anchor protein 9-like [Lingula anatina]|eukprot:XP_023932466.1 A-kinase anchor protein 9-like [Lingula anatina]
MSLQIEGLQGELENLTDFQSKLQEDYDTVQTMLEEKQKEIENLSKELEEARPMGATPELQLQYEQHIIVLEKELKERQNIIDEREEELYVLNEQLEEKEETKKSMEDLQGKLQRATEELDRKNVELQQREQEIEELQKKLSEAVREEPEAPGQDEVQQSEAELNLKVQQLETERDQLMAQCQDTQDKLNRTVSELGDKDQHIQQLQAQFQETKDKLIVELKENEDHIQQLVSQNQESKDNLVAELGEKEHQIQEYTAQLEKVKSELGLSKQVVEDLKRSHHRELTSVESRSKEDIHSLHQNLLEARAQLSVYQAGDAGTTARTMEQRLKELRQELTLEHEQHLTLVKLAAEKDTAVKLQELKEKLEREVEQLQEQHQRDLKNVTSATHQEVQEAHENEIRELRTEHAREVEQLQKMLAPDASVTELARQVEKEIEKGEQLDQNLLSHLEQQRQAGVGGDGSTDTSMAESSQEEIPPRLRSLLTKLHGEGMELLALSEIKPQGRHTPLQADLDTLRLAWENERQNLLSSIQSLKDLLAQTQRPESQASSGGESDWRASLIQAINFVFSKEREGLLAELRTFVATHGDQGHSEIQQMEQRIKDVDARHKSAMDQIFSADRQSLLAEVRDLQAHVSIIRLGHQEEKERLAEQLRHAEGQLTKRERQLKRQLEMLEYKLQQEKVICDDVRSSLEMEKNRTLELSGQLSREKSNCVDLQLELSEALSHLSKLKDTVDSQQIKHASVLASLEEEKSHSRHLKEELENERYSKKQLSDSLNEERRRSLNSKERETKTIEQLQYELDQERALHTEVRTSYEKEKLCVENMRRDLELQGNEARKLENKYKVKVAELMTALEMEKARNEEYNTALQRQQSVSNQLQTALSEERSSLNESALRERALIADLQAMLELEKSKVLDMQAALERDRYKVTSLSASLETTKTAAAEDIERERSASRQLRKQIDTLQLQKQDLQRQLDFERERSIQLQSEHDRVLENLQAVKEKAMKKDEERDLERQHERQRQRESDREREQDRQRQHETDAEVQRLRSRVSDLEGQLSESQRIELQTAQERDLQRLRALSRASDDLVDHMDNSVGGDESTSLSPRGSPKKDQLNLYKKQLESLRQRVQLQVIRLREEVDKLERESPGVDRGGSVEAMKRSAAEMINELGQIQTALLLDSQPGSVPIGSPPAHILNERILRHNSELTAFVSRLSQEKSELRDTLANLEEEIWRYRQREGAGSQGGDHRERRSLDSVESILATERAKWSREKSSLQMALRAAEKDLIRSKSEVNQLQFRLDRLQSGPAEDGATDPDVREKMQRLYGKYLRAESFRKALVYQKKYLLLLVGGFRDCEEETLATIARMGGHPPAQTTTLTRSRHGRALTKFRSAVRLVIAVCRLKFLVRKWKRATKVGSPVVTGTIPNGRGYMPTANSYTPPPDYSPPTSRSHQGHSPPTSRSHPGYTQPTSRLYTGTTPPTKDSSLSRFSPVSELMTSPGSAGPRRQILTALDPPLEPSPPPPPTAEATPTSSLPDDLSLHDDYIQRLENLQHRLARGTQGYRSWNTFQRR